MRVSNFLDEVLRVSRLDFVPAERQPTWTRCFVATLLAITGSLGADAAFVALGKALFPKTVHYSHFQFWDYSTLTVIGVLVACAGWPVITRLSLTPTWIYFRLALLISFVLLAPDVYIWLVQDQITQGVFVLVWMHLAIGVVTYYCVTRIAPAGAANAERTRP